jgi:hypothetical protein
METDFYEEKQVLWLRHLVYVLPPAALVMGYCTDSGVQGMILSSITAVLIGVGILGFTTLETRITASELIFGFPLWKKRVPLSSVRTGEITTIPFMAGTGLHYYRGYWVYNIRRGSGLVLFINRRKYLLGTSQPEKLQSVLWQKAGRFERS